MKYTRIYCDVDSVSHFEDVYVEVTPVDFAPPAPPLNLATPLEAERAVLCEFPAVIGIGRPHRQFYFQMSGVLEVQVGDGEIRRFSAGSLVLLDDISGKGHLTRVVGNTGVEAVFVQLAAMAGNAV